MLFTDQLHRTIELKQLPQRIVSLVPSQTELLFDLGLEAQVVGVTKFCVHPAEKVKRVTKVGGTKNIAFDRVAALQPDLVIGNKEENDKESIERLAAHFPVWLSDIPNLAEALQMIEQVGEITGRAAAAQNLAARIRQKFALLQPQRRGRAAYFIWRQPWLVAGSGTFIDNLLAYGGWENAFGHRPRYPEITAAELQAAAPDWLLLSSEPYPFKERHQAELQALCPQAQVRLVDGEMFSWYGSRLLLTPDYFRQNLD